MWKIIDGFGRKKKKISQFPKTGYGMHILRKRWNESFQGTQCKFHISTIKAPLVVGASPLLFALLVAINILYNVSDTHANHMIVPTGGQI